MIILLDLFHNTPKIAFVNATEKCGLLTYKLFYNILRFFKYDFIWLSFNLLINIITDGLPR